jgi:hypothetical protein
MKKKIKKLSKALKVVEKSKEKRAVYLVYLSIVLLGYKIPQVAQFFSLTELEVQAGLTVCGVRLNNPNKTGFRKKMHIAARMYSFEEELALNDAA